MTTLRLLRFRLPCTSSQLSFLFQRRPKIDILTDFKVVAWISSSESITTSSSSSKSIGIGSLVGGVLPVRFEEATDRALAAAEEFRARKSVKRDSGVFGSNSSEESERFDLYFALDALEMEATDSREALPAGVFGVAVEAEAEVTAGPFEKKDVKLFCFRESVAAVFLADIVAERDP